MSITVKRIVAFVLDLILVALLSFLVSISPLNPNVSKMNELSLSYEEKIEDWNRRAEGVEDGTAEAKELLSEFREISENYIYENCNLSIYETIIMIVIIICYFAVIPSFMDGATLGKRILGLSVVESDHSRASLFKLLIRATVMFGIPFNILGIITVLVLNKALFIKFYSILSFASYALSFAIILTTLLRQDKRGLHDIVAGTLVEERK